VEKVPFPLEEGFEGNRGSPLVRVLSGVALEDIEFLLNKVIFGREAKGFQSGDAKVGGEFEDLGLQALRVVDGADGVPHEEMPDSDGKFASETDGGFIAAATQREGKSPFAQRVLNLEKTLSGLNEKSADIAASVAFERSAAFPEAALGDTGIETEVGDEFFRIGKAADVADGAGQAVNGNEVESGETGQAKQLGIFSHFQSHLMTELLAAGPGADESGVHLFQEKELNWGPGFKNLEPVDGPRSRQSEAGREPQTVFVEHRSDVLLEARGFPHDALVSTEEFAAFAGTLVGLPDEGREPTQVDAGDLDGVDAIIGAVGLADLAGHLAFHDHGMTPNRLEAGRDAEGVAAGFHDESVASRRVASGPDLELGKWNLGGAMYDPSCGWVLPLQDSPGKGIGMNVESYDSTLWFFHVYLQLWLLLERRRGRVPTNALQADIRGRPIRGRTPHEGSSVRTQSDLKRGVTPLDRASPCRPVFWWLSCLAHQIPGYPDPAFFPRTTFSKTTYHQRTPFRPALLMLKHQACPTPGVSDRRRSLVAALR
jgi:hypothetical protein